MADEPVMYDHLAEDIRQNKCPTCSGKKTVVVDRDTWEMGICGKCKGTGEPDNNDYRRLAIHDKGICLVCDLPFRKDELHNCLDHLLQHVKTLEARIKRLERGPIKVGP